MPKAPFGNDPPKIERYKAFWSGKDSVRPLVGFTMRGWFPLDEYAATRAWPVNVHLTPEMVVPEAFLEDEERLLKEGEILDDDIIRGDMPAFGARNRGAERAAAAEARAMTAERDDRARELAATLESVAARHAALAEIEQLYAATTAPAAALNESAALREFGAARGGYAMLARSQRMRLEVERKRIAVTAERRLAAAQLMYLDGDQP